MNDTWDIDIPSEGRKKEKKKKNNKNEEDMKSR